MITFWYCYTCALVYAVNAGQCKVCKGQLRPLAQCLQDGDVRLPSQRVK